MTITKLSPKQRQIFNFVNSDTQSIICDGAVRSGKTICMSIAFVLWAMENFNHVNFAFCGRTVGSVFRNIILPLQEVNDLKKAYTTTFKRTQNLLVVKCGKRENYFYLFGGKDESSYTLIQGLTLSGVMFDEVALITRSFVEQAIARTLSVPNAKLWFNCNPDSPTHWFYVEWILDEKHTKDKTHLHFLMSDNPILGQEQLEKADKMYSGVFHDRYIKGLWKRAEGVVFAQFAENPERWIINKIEEKHFASINAGLDIGGNKSAYAFTITAIGYDGVIYVLYSKIIQAGDLDMDGVEKIVKDGVDYVEKTYKQDVEYINTDHVDVIINHLNRNTIYSARKTYKPTLVSRPRVFSQLLNTDKIKFVRNVTQDLTEQLKDLIYDDKSEEAIVLDDGSMQIDDWDSLVYSVSKHWKTLIDKE